MFRNYNYFVVVSTLLITTNYVFCESLEEIKVKYARRRFMQEEKYRGIGSGLELNKYEKIANQIIMKLKFEELDRGFKNPLDFLPARNFLEVRDNITNSPIFRILREMPKGAVLHGHDVALASAEFVLNLTKRDNVFAKVNSNNELLELRFSKNKSLTKEDKNGNKWINLTHARIDKKYTNIANIDDWLRPQLSLNQKDAGLNVNSIWNRFMQQFGRLTPLITYVDAWKDYFEQTLLEFYEDNVSYLEFRGLLNDVYDLDGKWLKGVKVAKLYVNVLEKFKKDHRCFFDAKFIYAPLRFVNETTFKPYSEMITKLLTKYPNFIAGFDLVGQEDIGNTLKKLTSSLIKEKRKLKFYFHAGETKWSGFHSDDNLIDAILLGTKRIGHGYAITKHPKVAEYIKRKRIGIELCPISNQVLGLVKDMRNHPAAAMFTDDYPIVIAPDDPGFWGAKGVSYDWYEAFMGLAAKWQDLRLLKQLALNSIRQAALNRQEKTELKRLWSMKWKIFIAKVIKYNGDFSEENIRKVNLME